MIHKTAIIDKSAILDEDVEVSPYAIIEKNVKIQKNVFIGPYVHIKGNTTIGENTFIGTGAVIGEMPQISGLRENVGNLYIGKNNIIREYVTIHTSTSKDSSTFIGDNNYLMGFSHIAHDCKLSNNIVICNGTLIAGHAIIEDKAFLSGNVVVHQFVRIGRLSMIGGLSRVNQDIPPFMMVVGDSKVWTINLVGLRRNGFSNTEISEIKNVFNILYKKNLPLSKALEKLKNINSPLTTEIVDFISSSKRGICGPHRSSFLERLFLDYPYLFLDRLLTIILKPKLRNF